MHFFRRKKSIKKNKKSRSLYTNGLKNLLKNHSFSFQNHVFPQEKSRQKASSTLPESIFPELFFQIKKSRKNYEKTQCFNTFASEKSRKNTIFRHKNNVFSRQKTSKSCEKKSILPMQMVKHVMVHFRDEKSRKKSKLTHKNVEKHNPLIRLVPKCLLFSFQIMFF